MEINLEDALSEKPDEDKEDASSVSDKKEEKKQPNILEFGLSKSSLNKMGFAFKDDASKSDQVVEPVPSPLVTRVTETFKNYKPPDAVSEPVASPQVARVNQLYSESQTPLSTDEDSPIPILKKAAKKATINETFEEEASRIEISPGLFVRKPKSASRNEERAMTPAKKVPLTAPMMESPETPELKTANIRELINQARKENANPNGPKADEPISKVTPSSPPSLVGHPTKADIMTPAKGANFERADPETPVAPILSNATRSLLKNKF